MTTDARRTERAVLEEPARSRTSGLITRRLWARARGAPAWAFSALQRRPHIVALAVILALGGALRLWNLARDVPTINSDEAVVGLMAIRLLHGQWTTFYWGQDYMGTLEALLAAPLIRLLGPTSLALRLAPLLASLGFILVVYRLGSLIYSRAVGLVAALLLALGTPFFMVVGVRALGGYAETLLMGASLILVALSGARPERRTWRWAALTGVIAGLALWTDPLVAPFLLATALVYVLQRRVDLVRWPHGGALIGGLVVGAFPAVIYNIVKPGATFAQMIWITLASGPRPTAAAYLQHVLTTLTVSLPVIMGAPFAGVQVTGLTANGFLRLAATHQATYAISFVALTLVALPLALSVVRLVRHGAYHRVTGARRFTASAVRRQAVLALLVTGAGYLAGFLLNRDTAVFASPRYLLPIYTLTPLVVGEAWLWLRRARLPRRPLGPRARIALSALVIALALAWNLSGTIALTPKMTAPIEDGQTVSGQDYELLTLLATRHIHTIVTSGYWIGYKITYESGETVIPVMLKPDGSNGYNRYLPYFFEGLRDPAPAYIELAATPQAALIRQRVASGDIPDYTLATVDGYLVAYPSRIPIDHSAGDRGQFVAAGKIQSAALDRHWRLTVLS